MYKSFLIIIMATVLFGCYNATEATALSEEKSKIIEKEVLALAEKWLISWNGEVDSKKMMSNYHLDMKYIWRGVSPPGNYETSKKAAESMRSLKTNYQLSMYNTDVTVIDGNNAIVFFHFKDKNGSPYGNGAVSLVMTNKDKEWKIIYVHESTIEPLE